MSGMWCYDGGFILEGEKHTRDYKMDNIRLLLMFCVLVGHFIEPFGGIFSCAAYKIIYSFHMPAFFFITGFFAHFDSRKILFNLVCPYILFQIIYQLFDAFIIKCEKLVTIQFGTPYWILWYLLVTIYCYCLLPLLDDISLRSKPVVVLVSLAVAILSGFDDSIGYYASFARFCSFFPYFLVGHYASEYRKKLRDFKMRYVCGGGAWSFFGIF